MTIKCDLCNKEFEYKAVLERHKNRKTPCIKKESYDCDICKSKFKFECDLKRHEKTNKHITNIKNNISNVNKTPSNELNLTNMFFCKLCNETFKIYYNENLKVYCDEDYHNKLHKDVIQRDKNNKQHRDNIMSLEEKEVQFIYDKLKLQEKDDNILENKFRKEIANRVYINNLNKENNITKEYNINIIKKLKLENDLLKKKIKF